MAELLSKDGNKVEFKVSVPAAEVSQAFDQVWAGLMRDVRVPGFRPGKAPKSLVAKRVGAGYVEQEVRDRLINAHYPQALRELKLSLVEATIDPEPVKSGGSFAFTVSGETYPEVTLGDWQSLEFKAQPTEITNEVLERTLTDLQDRNATFESVKRPAEGSDMVMIEEEGEEGSYPVYLDVAEEHVQRALSGKQKGDEVEITVPAHSHGDHEHPERVVKVKVLDVRRKQRQDLNDDFAKSLNFDSLERLRADLRSELERRASQEGEMKRREELIEHLVAGMQADIPESLLKLRRNAMMEDIKADLSRQGVRWDEYEDFMREQGKLESFEADLAKNAETRVRRDLALEQLAQDLQVTVSQSEFAQSLMLLAQQNGMDLQQLGNQIGQEGFNSYYSSMMRDKALAQALQRLSGEEASEAQGSEENHSEASAEPSEQSQEASEHSAEQSE